MAEFSVEQQKVITTLKNYGSALDEVYKKHHDRLQTETQEWDAVFILQFMITHNRCLIKLLKQLNSDEHSLRAFSDLLTTIPVLPEDGISNFLLKFNHEILTRQPLNPLLDFYREAPPTRNETVWKYLDLGMHACPYIMAGCSVGICILLSLGKATVLAILFNMLLLPILVLNIFLIAYLACMHLYPDQRTRFHDQRAHDGIKRDLDSVHELHENPFATSITLTIETTIDEETKDETTRTKTRTLSPGGLQASFFNGPLSKEVEESYRSLGFSA